MRSPRRPISYVEAFSLVAILIDPLQIINDNFPVVDPAGYCIGLQNLIRQDFAVPWQGAIPAVVWALLQKCWEYDPAKRPNMEQVMAGLPL